MKIERLWALTSATNIRQIRQASPHLFKIHEMQHPTVHNWFVGRVKPQNMEPLWALNAATKHFNGHSKEFSTTNMCFTDCQAHLCKEPSIVVDTLLQFFLSSTEDHVTYLGYNLTKWILTREKNRTHSYFSLLSFKGDRPAWAFSRAPMICASCSRWESVSRQKIGLEESFMLRRFPVLPLLHSQGHA